MSLYEHEKKECSIALARAIELTPRITRELIAARTLTRLPAQRQENFAMAISLTRALLDDLMLRQVRLGWHDRQKGDAA